MAIKVPHEWLQNAMDKAEKMGEKETGEDKKPSKDWKEDCLQFWGVLLTGKKAHWCPDFDHLPIDETCEEIEFCNCDLDDA